MGLNDRHPVGQKKMAPRGAILVSRLNMCHGSLTVMAMPNDHKPVMVVMTPAMIAMHFGTRVEPVMIVSDHDFLGTCNRWRGDGDRAKRCDNVSKLLHDVLLV